MIEGWVPPVHLDEICTGGHFAYIYPYVGITGRIPFFDLICQLDSRGIRESKVAAVGLEFSIDKVGYAGVENEEKRKLCQCFGSGVAGEYYLPVVRVLPGIDRISYIA